MRRIYGDDLAFIHDAGFGGFASAAAPGILAILRQHGIRTGRVVDLGCGSGIWARALLEAGYDVHGVDSSAAMIALARRRAPGGTFRTGSLWSAPVPACDAVTAIGESLNYRAREGNGRAIRDRLFRRIRGALRPGGLFVFDLVEKGGMTGSTPRAGGRMGRDWAVLVRSTEKGDRLRRDITSFRKSGQNYRRRDEIHELQLYDRVALAAQLRRAGFTVRAPRGYGEMTLPPHHVVLVARKK